MSMNIKSLWREPLLHFLLIGIALFVFYGLTRDVASEAPKRIVVNSGQLEQLTANFKRTWMRAPAKSELEALIDNHVREEVFYREALAMGLDQNDPMVKRRMRMKLEFILEDLASQDVTDEVLAKFLAKHPDKFRTEAQLSFEQVFFNPDKRKDLESDAIKLLSRLNNGKASKKVGDPTLLPAEFSLVSKSDIARSFGEDFAEDVIKLLPGDWIGPVYSAYGGHLLKVSERIDAQQPDLADIRELVKREYLAQLRKEQKDLAYQRLREGYEVTVEQIQMEHLTNTQAASTAEMVSTVQAGEIQQ